MLDVEHIKRSQ